MSADCVPVLLYDREKKVIAAIHAGWKGTVNGIVDKVVSAMKKEFGCLPGNIRAGIGPSICAASYEVGPEVIAQFREKVPDTEKLFSNFHGEKAHVDLWEANRAWLLRQGVPEENIEVAGICTFQNPGRFFSARYFKNRTGRFAACIALREIC
jgi:YfiH family protein